MVVDTSALIAILFGEAEATTFADLIDADPVPRISAISQVEATMVYIGRRRGARAGTIADLIDTLGLHIERVELAHANFAIDAFLRFGKGRHPAAFNLCDCFSYALAKRLDEPLLFKGNDFHKTDIVPAWTP